MAAEAGSEMQKRRGPVYFLRESALSQKLAGSSPFAKLAMKEGRVRLPLIITGTMEQPSYGLDMKGLAGTFQKQVEEQANEAVKGLLEGTTTPGDLQQQGRDILKGLFGR